MLLAARIWQPIDILKAVSPGSLSLAEKQEFESYKMIMGMFGWQRTFAIAGPPGNAQSSLPPPRPPQAAGSADP